MVMEEASRAYGLQVEQFSETLEKRQAEWSVRVVNANEDDPISFTTFTRGEIWDFSAKGNAGTKMRIGGAKLRWIAEEIKKLWNRFKEQFGNEQGKTKNTIAKIFEKTIPDAFCSV